jgi:hypothetical protein
MNAGVTIGDCGWRNSHETLKIDERWSGDWGLLTEAASRSNRCSTVRLHTASTTRWHPPIRKHQPSNRQSSTPHSTIRILNPAILNLQCLNLQSAIINPAIANPQWRNLQSAILNHPSSILNRQPGRL